MSNLPLYNVFIDSSIFYNYKYDIQNDLLGKIRELAREEKIKLFSTTFSIQENHKKIHDLVKEELLSLKQTINKTSIFKKNKTTIFSDLEIKTNSLVQSYTEAFDKYISECNTTVISNDTISISELSQKYFRTKPPFKNSTNKKNEFPDAIQLYTLNKHMRGKDPYYLISKDPDFKSYSNHGDDDSGSIYLDSIKSFLKILNEFDHNAEVISETLKQYKEEIKDQLTYILKEGDFYLDHEGEIHEINITDMDFVDYVPFKIDADKVSMLIDVHFTYNGSLNYLDYDKADYDKVNGVYHNLNIINVKTHGDDYASVIVEIMFKENYQIIDRILDIKLNRNTAFLVNLT